MIKYYTKLKEKIYDLLTFENEENNLCVQVTFYVSVLGIFFTMFIYFGIEFLHNSGMLLKCINSFISIMFLAIFVKFLVIIDKIMSRKNTEKEILSEDNLKNDLNENFHEEKFMSFFQDKAFYDFRNIAIENNIISESGKYIYSNTQRHLTILIGKLYDNRLIKDVNRRDFCLVAKKYFQTNIDYSEMNTVINDCLKDELTGKNDKKAFEKLNIFDSIKI